MKRTLITAGVATVFATLGLAAYAHGEARSEGQPCTQADGKACPADGKGTHQHDRKGGPMQGRMQGMQGMHGKHGDMEKNHAGMAAMQARMHGSGTTSDKDGKEGEHKH